MARKEAAVATIDKKAAKAALVPEVREERVTRDGAETRERRIAHESVDTRNHGDETRKQQIARRLKVSERVLEQYFQSKQAEVEEESTVVVAPERSERSRAREKHV